MKHLLIVTICALFTSCVSNKSNYYLNPEARIETLSICLSYSEQIDSDVQKSFENVISDEIIRFNHEKHKFKLSKCNDSTFRSLNINVNKTKFVTNQNRIASALISLAGLGVTFWMYYTNPPILITFWHIPETKTETYFSLSSDLTYKNTPNIVNPSNSAFFLNRTKQIEKHKYTFVKFVRKEIIKLENQYNYKY